MIRRVHYSPDLLEEWCAEGALSGTPTKHVWIKDRIWFHTAVNYKLKRHMFKGLHFSVILVMTLR